MDFYQVLKGQIRIRFFCLTVLKTNLFVRFLEESEDTKKSFRNYTHILGLGGFIVDASYHGCQIEEVPGTTNVVMYLQFWSY